MWAKQDGSRGERVDRSFGSIWTRRYCRKLHPRALHPLSLSCSQERAYIISFFTLQAFYSALILPTGTEEQFSPFPFLIANGCLVQPQGTIYLFFFCPWILIARDWRATSACTMGQTTLWYTPQRQNLDKLVCVYYMMCHPSQFQDFAKPEGQKCLRFVVGIRIFLWKMEFFFF